MYINIKVKPIKYTATTKSQLLEKMKMHGFSVGTYGETHSSGMDKDRVRVYTCEKRRRKTVQTRKPGSDKTKSSVVRNGHWVGCVYNISHSLLSAAGLKVKQENNTFKLVSKKK